MRKWALLVSAVLTEVTASLALKGALEHSALYAVVAVGYLASFGLLSAVLRLGVPLGVAYGVWGALGVTLTAVMSSILYGEPVTAVMALGMALVVAGVLTVELGQQAASRDVAVREAMR